MLVDSVYRLVHTIDRVMHGVDTIMLGVCCSTLLVFREGRGTGGAVGAAIPARVRVAWRTGARTIAMASGTVHKTIPVLTCLAIGGSVVIMLHELEVQGNARGVLTFCGGDGLSARSSRHHAFSGL